MSWVSNLSITISTIVIFFYGGGFIGMFIYEILASKYGWQYKYEKYMWLIVFLSWLIINILQWYFFWWKVR